MIKKLIRKLLGQDDSAARDDSAPAEAAPSERAAPRAPAAATKKASAQKQAARDAAKVAERRTDPTIVPAAVHGIDSALI